jgi:hypothetical protein
MSKSDLIDLPCMLKYQTERAYLLDFGEEESMWLPKSQVEYHKEGNNEIVTMPEWLAKERGLI